VSHPRPSGTNAPTQIFLIVLVAAAAAPSLRRRDEQIP
jgi:hypothetical protein